MQNSTEAQLSDKKSFLQNLGETAYKGGSMAVMAATLAKNAGTFTTGGIDFFLAGSIVNANQGIALKSFAYNPIDLGGGNAANIENLRAVGGKYFHIDPKSGRSTALSNSQVEGSFINHASKKAGGVSVNPGHMAFVGLNALFMGSTMYDAYNMEGSMGLLNAAITNSVAYNFGAANTFQAVTYNSANVSQAELNRMGYNASEVSQFQSGKTQLVKPNDFFRLPFKVNGMGVPFASHLFGMLAPMAGAHVGASLGFAGGKMIGEGISSLLGMENNSLAGTVGGIFGAMGVAPITAKLGSNVFGALALGGIAAGVTAMVKTGSGIINEGMKKVNQNRRGLDFANDTQPFFSRNAVTIRQRALQAMNNSYSNARSALGNEATIMHMNRDYFSTHGRL